MSIEIPNINEDCNYWLVRTNSGEYYQEFFLDNFVAIGWNEFNDLDYLNSKNDSFIVEQIRKKYPNEDKPRHVLNQIRRFVFEMKQGDIVLIPSKGSTHVSFGKVITNVEIANINEDEIEEGVCPFQKRRKVKWIKTVRRDELDPYLYKLLYSQHTITNALDYAPYIDRTLHSIFTKGGYTHLVLDVTTRDRIKAKDLANLIDGAENIIELFNEVTESSLDSNEIELKINVQSPGPIEYIAGAGVILVFGMILHYIVGGKFQTKLSWESVEVAGETEGLLEKILKFRERASKDAEIEQRLGDIRSSMDRLNVKLPEELSIPKKQEDEEKLV